MKQSKRKKYRISFATRLDQDVLRALDQYAQESGQSKTDIVNAALGEYLDKQAKMAGKNKEKN